MSKKKSAEFSTQAMAGMPNAMISPSRQTCHDRRCTPAVNVPSDSKVKIASPVALALKLRCTVGSSIMFMTMRNASQCSTCVTTRRQRAALSLALGQPARNADQYNEGDEDLPVARDRLPREGRVGNPEDCQD